MIYHKRLIIIKNSKSLRKLFQSLGLLSVFLFQLFAPMLHPLHLDNDINCATHAAFYNNGFTDLAGIHQSYSAGNTHHDPETCPICHHLLTHVSIILSCNNPIAQNNIIDKPILLIKPFQSNKFIFTCQSRAPPLSIFS